MSATVKTDIRKLSLDQLKELCEAAGEKPYRAKQIWEWLWQKSATSFSEMTSLSKGFRGYLEEHCEIKPVQVDLEQKSSDGTIKLRFRLFDGNLVEGVLIPADDRMTACISSQVGCSLSCKFCATGYMPRLRNIDAAEIYDQVVLINHVAEKNYQSSLTNIVYMGMGEPLLNYRNVLQSVEHITSPQGLHMGARRLTVSTAGIAKMIRKLADDDTKFNLALSLHAANDEKRSTIMPINEQNSLEALAEALKYYYDRVKRMVTYEYIVFYDINDNIEDAKELAAFCKHIPCKVNLIEYNPIDMADYANTSGDRLDAFKAYLESKNISATIRRSRGKDVDAACGQLANKDS